MFNQVAISFITYCMKKEEGFSTNGLVVKEVATRIASFPTIRLRSERNIM